MTPITHLATYRAARGLETDPIEWMNAALVKYLAGRVSVSVIAQAQARAKRWLDKGKPFNSVFGTVVSWAVSAVKEAS